MTLSNKGLTVLIAVAVMYQAAGHEPEPPKRDTIAAGMLLATVVYLTATLGMANQMRDRKLRKLTLSALHTKISIFIAVLMYQAIKGFFQSEGEEDNPDLWGIFHCFCGVLVWFIVLQLMMVWINYEEQRGFWHCWMSLTSRKQDWPRERELLLQFWATLMGHIVGFACIDLFTKIQTKMFQSCHGFGVCLAASGIAMISMTGFYKMMKEIRKRIDEWLGRSPGRLARFEEAAEDTENDAIALTISFLICQALRLLITGYLPNGEGLTERYLTHDPNHTNETGTEPAFGGPLAEPRTYLDIVRLCIPAHLLILIVLLWRDCSFFDGMKKRFEERVHDGEKRLERITDVASDIAAMTVAWTSYFGVTWFLDTTNRAYCSHWGSHVNCGSGGMTGSVFLALFCTLIAYFMIYVFSKISDYRCGSTCRDLSESALKAQGLLIGFSWEKSFDLAVEDISDKVHDHKDLYRFLVSFFVSAMVGLVWKLFLLPQVVSHKNEDHLVELADELFEMMEDRPQGGYAPLPGGVPDERESKILQKMKELREQIEETFEKYMNATGPLRNVANLNDGDGASGRARRLQRQAEQFIVELNANPPTINRDDVKQSAIVCNQMTRGLRRYEELEVVEVDDE